MCEWVGRGEGGRCWRCAVPPAVPAASGPCWPACSSVPPLLLSTPCLPAPNHLLSLQAPNPDDPLNKEAAQMMQQSPAQFERTVAQSITRGCSIGGEYFPPARGERSSG